MQTLEDVLPPPPHKVLKEVADDAKGLADSVRRDIAGVADDVRVTAVQMAPHNMIREAPKPNPKEFLPPPPPKPEKPDLPKLSK